MGVSGRRAGMGALLLATVCAAGCSSEEPTSNYGGTGGTSGAGGTSGGEMMECICSDGLTGECRCATSSCNACASPCNCDGCAPFETPTLPPFEACGGEPFGYWHTTVFPPEPYLVLGAAFKTTWSCPANPSTLPAPFDFRIHIGDGGVLKIIFWSGLSTATALRSCLADGSDLPCNLAPSTNPDLTGFDPEAYSCVETGCGICECVFRFNGARDEDGEWSRATTPVNTLWFEANGNSSSFEYCVRGDTLELRRTYSDIRYRLDRVVPSGVPTPCSSRAPDCYGCTPGICVGTGTCTGAAAESECTNRIGCTWDPTQCSGEAGDTCLFESYDAVPGCTFVRP